jgi:serine/threonine protein kinase
MIHRMRSLRGRSLRDKYNVDWNTTLGEGAYGSVHPARLAVTGEKVALKKIAKQYTDTSSFRRETDALLRIFNNGGHPNISGLRDMYEDSTHYYLVMDLVSGGEMFDHLIQFGAYSEADAARLMQEVVSALWFLHGVGVVHNDLKPENLLLCSKQRVNGTIKMIDFGCAVVQQGDASDDESEAQHDNNGGGRGGPLHPPSQPAPQSPTLPKIPSTGTTAYWPPERFAGSMPNSATDMWAVGIILFIMLTGVHPFDLTGVATDADIEAQIKSDPSPPITPGLTSHLSPSAIDLIKKLLQPDAKDRITADEMLHHPWVTGDEAATDVMEKSQVKLKKFVDLRNILEAGIFSIMVEHGNRDMALSEYAPQLAYRDEVRGGKGASPATSVLKRAFEVFDEEGKGFVSADDLGRVVNQVTGKELTEREKEHMMAATNPETLKDHSTTAASPSMGLSLSKFSKVCGGLKHKHYPRGHIIFHAGDVGDAMYFINSGKVEIQTR